MVVKIIIMVLMQINLNFSDLFFIVMLFSVSNVDSYNKKGLVIVFDSQGNVYDMSVYFVKIGDNNWQVYIQDSSDLIGIVEFVMKLVFNVNGVLILNLIENIIIGVINGVDFVMFSLSFFNFMQ